jgi:hypothetical protein
MRRYDIAPYIPFHNLLTVPWFSLKPSRELTEDDKALHRAIGAVKRERGE